MALARDARSRRLDDWDVGSGEHGIGGCGARSRSSARPPTDGGSPRSRAGQRACARCERWYTRSGWSSRSSVRRTLRRRTHTAPVCADRTRAIPTGRRRGPVGGGQGDGRARSRPTSRCSGTGTPGGLVTSTRTRRANCATSMRRSVCKCREPGHLRDLQVLVDEAAEPVSSERADARSGTGGVPPDGGR